ncbi:type II toxin-antitoxin system VapC family toxin [Candidatus Borrarchaeum sp.]|uniref:type II toxin-antitoxin system VapC family toxin n=1 Tax=Candidatus Borrarchaeum sp. TaxID=2846742 RepID=UPI00257D3E2E|nr:type II toxin-antitoxin system VapC family toxin [Candidatus Borrarchaeum sp.]
MPIYLDSNVFYNAYCPVENQKHADWLLNQLTENFYGVTCEWTILEMFRALKKQSNLGTISEKDANITLDFFLSDIGEMNQKKILTLVPVTKTAIMASRNQIFNRNLYAAEALHAVIAINSNADIFVTYDSDFRGILGTIPVINPDHESFTEKILELKSI